MNYVYEVCNKCGDRYCCRGLRREMNDYLVRQKGKKTKTYNGNKKSFK